MQALHHWLKAKRLAAGLTQEEVAEQIHCTQPTYWQYEQGHRAPPLQRLLFIALLYDEKPEQVIMHLPKRRQKSYLAKLAAHWRRFGTTANGASTSRWATLLGLLDAVRAESQVPKGLQPYVLKLQAWAKNRLRGQ